MELEILEESGGPVQIILRPPQILPHFQVPGTESIILKASGLTGIFQEFKGTDCSGWFNQYIVAKPVILRARGAIPTLELRIALSQPLIGTWDSIAEPVLNAHFYNIYYTPFVATRAIFQRSIYETFDVHFTLSVLAECGIQHKALDVFISKIIAGRPAALFPHQMPSSTAMRALIAALRHLNHTKKLQLQLFDLKMKQLILIALEPLLSIYSKPYHVSFRERQMLYAAKEIIAQGINDYHGNAFICKKTGLNEFNLKQGFKAIFGKGPYDYHLELKINRSKKLLLETNATTRLIAYELGYHHPASFGKEFIKHTGLCPEEFRGKKDLS